MAVSYEFTDENRFQGDEYHDGPSGTEWTGLRPDKERAMTTIHTVDVDGLSVFYRQAGPPAAPKLLLLGGSPRPRTSFAI